jgi:hypothetical protein
MSVCITCANEVTSHLRSDDAIQDFNDPEVTTVSRRDWFQHVTDFFPDEVKCTVAQIYAVCFMLSLLKQLPVTSMRHVEYEKINPVIYGSASQLFEICHSTKVRSTVSLAYRDDVGCQIVDSGWNIV